MVRWKFKFSNEPKSYAKIKEVRDGGIKQFYWNFTHKCSQNCIQCYAYSGKKEELSTKEALSVVDKIAESGANLLTFCGESLWKGTIFLK